MLTKTTTSPRRPAGILTAGIAAGLAGGLAEIAVVCAYATVSGRNASDIARQVGFAAGLGDNSVTTGLAVHMGLAAGLGLALSLALQIVGTRAAGRTGVYALMLACLGAVWAVNFFIILPAVSPGFVHLLPYALTLTSKLAFGIAAASTFCGFGLESSLVEGMPHLDPTRPRTNVRTRRAIG